MSPASRSSISVHADRRRLSRRGLDRAHLRDRGPRLLPRSVAESRPAHARTGDEVVVADARRIHGRRDRRPQFSRRGQVTAWSQRGEHAGDHRALRRSPTCLAIMPTLRSMTRGRRDAHDGILSLRTGTARARPRRRQLPARCRNARLTRRSFAHTTQHGTPPKLTRHGVDWQLVRRLAASGRKETCDRCRCGNLLRQGVFATDSAAWTPA